MRLFAGTPFDRPPKCDRCQLLESDCQCPQEKVPAKPPGKQTARIRLEKRTKGKSVTTIRDLDFAGDHLSSLLTKLKNHCGAGGTVDGDIIEVQGDHVSRIAEFLKKEGYRVGN